MRAQTVSLGAGTIRTGSDSNGVQAEDGQTTYATGGAVTISADSITMDGTQIDSNLQTNGVTSTITDKDGKIHITKFNPVSPGSIDVTATNDLSLSATSMFGVGQLSASQISVSNGSSVDTGLSATGDVLIDASSVFGSQVTAAQISVSNRSSIGANLVADGIVITDSSVFGSQITATSNGVRVVNSSLSVGLVEGTLLSAVEGGANAGIELIGTALSVFNTRLVGTTARPSSTPGVLLGAGTTVTGNGSVDSTGVWHPASLQVDSAGDIVVAQGVQISSKILPDGTAYPLNVSFNARPAQESASEGPPTTRPSAILVGEDVAILTHGGSIAFYGNDDPGRGRRPVHQSGGAVSAGYASRPWFLGRRHDHDAGGRPRNPHRECRHPRRL